jgi:hypothetical protein
MKQIVFAALLATSATAALAADVDVSINIGHPNFFGRIELGSVAPPPLVYARPVVIERAPREVVVEPIYLRVPPGHAKNWRHYCARYDACGRPVYFVKDEWYRNVYAPHYREEHREWRHEEARREEYREERREAERREEHRERIRHEERREEHSEENHGKHHHDHDDRGHGDHDRG